MQIKLIPVDRKNKKAVLALSVRDDQPFVASNKTSLRQAEEANAEQPGVARPFGIYADDRLVGFCMFAVDPEDEDEDGRYYLWRFMIDKEEQGKGYGQAALSEIIRYFRELGADRLLLSTEPENELGLHVYHKAGFRETGSIDDGEAVLRLWLTKKTKKERDTFLWYGVNVKERLHIREKNSCGVSMAISDGEELETYCAGSGRYGQDFPVNPEMLFQAGSVSKPMFALTLLRYADKGLVDLDADLSGVVPEFVKKGPLTFAALLSHTAGFNLHGFPRLPGGSRTAFPGGRAERQGQHAEAPQDPALRKAVHVFRRRHDPGRAGLHAHHGDDAARGVPKGGRRAPGAEADRLFPAPG